jgi:hypothetical protein
MIDREGIRLRWETLGCKLDERGQRLFAANEVRAAGRGALIVVSRITGLARSTINRGEDDLEEGPLPEGRVRRKGGGPKPLSERDPTLVSDLQRLAELTGGCCCALSAWPWVPKSKCFVAEPYQIVPACFISFWRGEASAMVSGASIGSQSKRLLRRGAGPIPAGEAAPFQFAVHIGDARVDHDLRSDYAAAASNP